MVYTASAPFWLSATRADALVCDGRQGLVEIADRGRGEVVDALKFQESLASPSPRHLRLAGSRDGLLVIILYDPCMFPRSLTRSSRREILSAIPGLFG